MKGTKVGPDIAVITRSALFSATESFHPFIKDDRLVWKFRYTFTRGELYHVRHGSATAAAAAAAAAADRASFYDAARASGYGRRHVSLMRSSADLTYAE